MQNKHIQFEMIRNASVSQNVMEQIKEALVNKTLHPGDRMPTEAELCKNMGVGKSSVREAIKMLEVLGVVETRQGDGTYIATNIPENSINPLVYQLLFDYGNNSDIFELRAMFEPAYTLMAMKKATDSDIDTIQEVCRSFEEKVRTNTQRAEDDLSFHKAILEATHNPFIIRIGATILQLFYASIANSMKEIPGQAVRDHTAILKAFLEKDEQALTKAIYDSFEGWSYSMNRR